MSVFEPVKNHKSYILNPSNSRIIYAYQELDGFMMYDIRYKIYDFSPAQTPTLFFGNLTCRQYIYNMVHSYRQKQINILNQ